MARFALLIATLAVAVAQVNANSRFRFNGPNRSSQELCLAEGSTHIITLDGVSVSYTIGSWCGSLTVNSGRGINVNGLG
ncbi:hypothetical protein C8034_v011591 [Colletotrichum sidae]|uniref:Uncharacterized protein n=1 Tax=Colletotrichum sidae TaxID=1347389 RepID=A0A4R8TG37_9PEZI|nr:hypothetical protein C8034_v011591 [Colletotrichum sidae]